MISFVSHSHASAWKQSQSLALPPRTRVFCFYLGIQELGCICKSLEQSRSCIDGAYGHCPPPLRRRSRVTPHLPRRLERSRVKVFAKRSLVLRLHSSDQAAPGMLYHLEMCGINVIMDGERRLHVPRGAQCWVRAHILSVAESGIERATRRMLYHSENMPSKGHDGRILDA